MLADFHNFGITPDLNDKLNKCAKGVDSSSANTNNGRLVIDETRFADNFFRRFALEIDEYKIRADYIYRRSASANYLDTYLLTEIGG